MVETICWKCANACNDGCSWSEKFELVPGCEYVKDEKKDGKIGYVITKCPEFVKEDRKNRSVDFDDEACVRLVLRLLELTREDYITGKEKTCEEIERFIRGRGASRLHRLGDPEGTIRMLKQAKLERKKKNAQAMIT